MFGDTKKIHFNSNRDQLSTTVLYLLPPPFFFYNFLFKGRKKKGLQDLARLDFSHRSHTLLSFFFLQMLNLLPLWTLALLSLKVYSIYHTSILAHGSRPSALICHGKRLFLMDIIHDSLPFKYSITCLAHSSSSLVYGRTLAQRADPVFFPFFLRSPYRLAKELYPA